MLKRKIAMAMATTAVGAALIGGGTFALFTDTAANEGNTFTAGTLSIDVSDGRAFSTTQYINNLAPGDTESATLTIENDGSLDAWVKVSPKTSGALFEGDHPLNISIDDDVVKIPANSSHTFNVTYDFPRTAGNTYQGATGTVTFNVEAVQARNNTNTAEDGPKDWK